MKRLLALLVFCMPLAASAQFNPVRPELPQPYLACRGTGDYPNASITYSQRNRNFTVSVSYDLDVPGGAEGSISRMGTGTVTPQGLNIAIQGGGAAQGPFQGGSYKILIAFSNIRAVFDCHLNQ